MLCEDDITWAEGSRSALAADLQSVNPDVGFLSLYCANRVSREIERRQRRLRLKRGWHESRLGWESWGSQCLIFPRPAALRLLVDPQFNDFRVNYEKNRNRDAVTAKCVIDLGMKTLYRIPCLVNHDLGSGNSSLRLKPVQKGLTTRYWTGKP